MVQPQVISLFLSSSDHYQYLFELSSGYCVSDSLVILFSWFPCHNMLFTWFFSDLYSLLLCVCARVLSSLPTLRTLTLPRVNVADKDVQLLVDIFFGCGKGTSNQRCLKQNICSVYSSPLENKRNKHSTGSLSSDTNVCHLYELEILQVLCTSKHYQFHLPHNLG